MAGESSLRDLKEKGIIAQGIAQKLYPFRQVIFLVGPGQILEFETRKQIKLMGVKKCVSILFFESQPEAESSQISMIASLEDYKSNLMELAVSGNSNINREKVLAIVNYCLGVLNRAEFMRIDFQ